MMEFENTGLDAERTMVRIDGKPTVLRRCTGYFESRGQTEADRSEQLVEIICDPVRRGKVAVALWGGDVTDKLRDYRNIGFVSASDDPGDLATVVFGDGVRIAMDRVVRLMDIDIRGYWMMTRGVDMLTLVNALPKEQAESILQRYECTIREFEAPMTCVDDDSDDFGGNDGYEAWELEVPPAEIRRAEATKGRELLRIYANEINARLHDAVMRRMAETFIEHDIEEIDRLNRYRGNEQMGLFMIPDLVYWLGGPRDSEDDIKYDNQRIDPRRFDLMDLYPIIKSLKK